MQFELPKASQAKLEDILEYLYTRYDMEDLSSEDLIDVLLDIGVDLVMAEGGQITLSRDRLLSLCSKKINMEV